MPTKKDYLCSVFLVYLYSVLNLFAEPIRLSLFGIISYCILDLLIGGLQMDMIIHHILTIRLSIYGLKGMESFALIRTLLETEYSTFFLLLRNIGFHHPLNTLLFFLSYTHFRMYRIGIMVLQLPYSNVLLNLYFLYALYIYWYLLIIHFILKKIY